METEEDRQARLFSMQSRSISWSKAGEGSSGGGGNRSAAPGQSLYEQLQKNELMAMEKLGDRPEHIPPKALDEEEAQFLRENQDKIAAQEQQRKRTDDYEVAVFREQVQDLANEPVDRKAMLLDGTTSLFDDDAGQDAEQSSSAPNGGFFGVRGLRMQVKKSPAGAKAPDATSTSGDGKRKSMTSSSDAAGDADKFGPGSSKKAKVEADSPASSDGEGDGDALNLLAAYDDDSSDEDAEK